MTGTENFENKMLKAFKSTFTVNSLYVIQYHSLISNTTREKYVYYCKYLEL